MMKKNICMLIALAFAIEIHSQADPDPSRFNEEIKTFRAWDSKNAIPAQHVLFVGSSSIRMWRTADMFPDLPIVNRGFGGAHFSDMLFFKDDILLRYGAPLCIVLYCGDNDVASGVDARQVIENFQAWWTLVQDNFPSTSLIYLPIKPCPSRWNKWPEAKKVNDAIRAMAERDAGLYYADTATPVLETGEPPAQDLFMEDLLHLSDKGYAIWTAVLRPLLDDIVARQRAQEKIRDK
ncbi:hypothetical protein JXA02_07060 [candidate division KSB1 bacterium]|nr:hypothetical protein [candidate division KSB1 bacterium]RQW06714.1 MAG: hypothetical protein EH222_08225 [candidate division KSB1 bacterium]